MPEWAQSSEDLSLGLGQWEQTPRDEAMLAGWVRSRELRLLPPYRACCRAHHLSQLDHLAACSQGLGPQPGPLSELHYPIESMTKEPKDFPFVTFGRMLHVLSSAIRKEASEDADTPGSSYKKKVASKDKARDQGQRVAPGETQLVQEVQRFLLHNGVSLDSFSQATAERSKTMILAKNLPAGTLAAELRETFGHFGSLG
ncbi:putative RNA-binding protein 19 [Sciurus carolinensis]|uniref:RNA-binding protein 19 n=1 Tax=Sciurus carolinensis TaxID=30640 RepID=A0AA41T4V4_SCICA|nr:putative RNA-binding protein 19 [Sciurus carolinensis]